MRLVRLLLLLVHSSKQLGIDKNILLIYIEMPTFLSASLFLCFFVCFAISYKLIVEYRLLFGSFD